MQIYAGMMDTHIPARAVEVVAGTVVGLVESGETLGVLCASLPCLGQTGRHRRLAIEVAGKFDARKGNAEDEELVG